MKNAINPKEKARRRAVLDAIVVAERLGKEQGRAALIKATHEEKAFQARCRKAMRKVDDVETTLGIPVDNYFAVYYPRTGEVLWRFHTDGRMVGHSALRPTKVKTKIKTKNETGRYVLEEKEGPTKDGPPVIYGEGGKPYTAARLCYAAIHGPIPEGHVVYCVDNDPTNLVATNLRCISHRRKVVLPDHIREKLRALREAREARSQS